MALEASRSFRSATKPSTAVAILAPITKTPAMFLTRRHVLNAWDAAKDFFGVI
jgi:hypothetical protein